MNANNEIVVEQLIAMLLQENAHASFDHAVETISYEKVGVKPASLPYSIWQLTEHIRIAQWDILEFSKNAYHKSPQWPKDYWPADAVPPSEEAWNNCLQQIKLDREEFVTLLTRPDTDLYEPFAHGHGQNLLREALLIIDHNSYHTGQIILIRKMLDDWNK